MTITIKPEMTTAQLVEAHNKVCEMTGATPVKRFSDRATAEKRTRYVLSLVAPHLRPEPFREEMDATANRQAQTRVSKAQGRAKDTIAMKGSVRAKDAPHPAIKSVTSVSGKALEERERREASAKAAIEAKPAPATPVASALPRWARPKHTEPAKVAYLPRKGSKQDAAYALLTQREGVHVDTLCVAMIKLGASPKSWTPEKVWGELTYLFVTQKGYGLDFDGSRLTLLVPKEERPAPPPASKKGA